MPFTNLSDRLLTSDGILDKLIAVKRETALLPPEKVNTIIEKKLETIRNNLKSIFFETLTNQEIQEVLSSPNSRFKPNYMALHLALSTLFSDQTIDEMIEHISHSTEADWAPKLNALNHYYQLCNQEYEYFTNPEKEDALFELFESLVIACQKVTVLIEKNNTSLDIMAFDYAYTLMALLVDEDKPIPNLRSLGPKIMSLLTPKDRSLEPTDKPFHDNLLDLKLPSIDHDREGWIKLIEKEGARVLRYFSNAIRIQEHTHKHLAPKTWQEAQQMNQLCLYARADEDPAFTKLCYENDVEEHIFNACLDYIGSPTVWPKKTSDSIPSVTIEDTTNDYVWTKLPINDKRALILGAMTHSCQSIGDHSERCVKDAVNLNTSGLYVLLKRKKGTTGTYLTDEGLINDEAFQVIGQSYVWLSKAENLCLDSIECLIKPKIPDEQLSDILTTFSEKILLENPSIKRVTLGMGGKTPEHLYPNHTTLPEVVREGFIYGDAYQQYLIAQQPSRLSEASRIAIENEYVYPARDVLLYLCEHITDTTNIVQQLKDLFSANPSQKDMLCPRFLFDLLRFTPSPTWIDLQPVNWSALSEEYSLGRMVSQATSLEQMVQILERVQPEERIAVAKARTDLFYNQNHQPILFQQLLNLIPEGSRLKLIECDRNDSFSFIFHLSPEQIKQLIESLPEEDRLAALLEKNDYDYTLFYTQSRFPDMLEWMLDKLPERQRLDAVKKFGGVLKMVANRPELIPMIVTLYPQEERLLAVSQKDIFGNSLLKEAITNATSFKWLLALYPTAKERFAAVKEKGESGVTLLEKAISYHEVLRSVLELYPIQDLIEALQTVGSKGLDLLWLACTHLASLQVILEFVPIEIFIVSPSRLGQYETTLHAMAASSRHHSFKLFLEHIPEEQRLSVLQTKLTSGATILDETSKNMTSLQIALDSLSTPNLMTLIQYQEKPWMSDQIGLLKQVLVRKYTHQNCPEGILTNLKHAGTIKQLQVALTKIILERFKSAAQIGDEASPQGPSLGK